jgi:hypothetical protein
MKKQANFIPDDDIVEFLSASKNKTRTINEALRQMRDSSSRRSIEDSIGAAIKLIRLVKSNNPVGGGFSVQSLD